MSHRQVHVTISGLVQGVGFRHSLWRQARKRGISGWVRNRADGAVDALFQGEMNSVEDLIEWCRVGPAFAEVSEVHVILQNKEKNFDSFDILS